MRKGLISELTKLYTGELASIAVFLLVYYLRFKAVVLPVFYPLLVLCLILLQGASYWFICLQRLNGKPIKNVGRVFYLLKYLDLALIAVSIPVLFMSDRNALFDIVMGCFILLFAIVEWINYFVIRLSYRNPKLLIDLIKHNKLKRSKLAKEIAER